jgi:autonomous glycyl radical cofactor GrcA
LQDEISDLMQNINLRTTEDIKVTLTQEEYDNIQRIQYSQCTEKECTQCIICNDDFKNDDIVKITKCKHMIHDDAPEGLRQTVEN